jgi:hypothetical protein
VRRVDELRVAVAATVSRLQADEDRQAQARNQLGALAGERRDLADLAERHRAWRGG